LAPDLRQIIDTKKPRITAGLFLCRGLMPRFTVECAAAAPYDKGRIIFRSVSRLWVFFLMI
jgi:hypothetical protein